MPDKINKMPKFYMIFARKFFSRIFFGRGATAPLPLPPVSYAYGIGGRVLEEVSLLQLIWSPLGFFKI